MTKSTATRISERAAVYGIETLSDAELLAVTTGISRDQLQVILDQYSLYEIMSLLDTIDLKPEQKIRIEALLQIGLRISRAQFQGGVVIRTPMDIGSLFLREMQHKTVEVVMAAVLNVRNRLIRIEPIAIGGVGSAMISPREVARVALRHNGSSVILAHNHPSGDTSPSLDDIDTTKRLADGLEMLGIHLLDHLIIGISDFSSLKQKGLI